MHKPLVKVGPRPPRPRATTWDHHPGRLPGEPRCAGAWKYLKSDPTANVDWGSKLFVQRHDGRGGPTMSACWRPRACVTLFGSTLGAGHLQSDRPQSVGGSARGEALLELFREQRGTHRVLDVDLTPSSTRSASDVSSVSSRTCCRCDISCAVGCSCPHGPGCAPRRFAVSTSKPRRGHHRSLGIGAERRSPVSEPAAARGSAPAAPGTRRRCGRRPGRRRWCAAWRTRGDRSRRWSSAVWIVSGSRISPTSSTSGSSRSAARSALSNDLRRCRLRVGSPMTRLSGAGTRPVPRW